MTGRVLQFDPAAHKVADVLLPWLVNGTRGLTGIPRPLGGLVGSTDYKYLLLAICGGFLVLTYFLIERAIRSPWGRVLMALREDEMATEASGKNVFAFKMQSFVMGAAIMGAGGAIYAYASSSLTPEVFTHFFATFLFWAMLILGGSGNNRGAIVGAYVGLSKILVAVFPVFLLAWLRFGIAAVAMVGWMRTPADEAAYHGRVPRTGVNWFRPGRSRRGGSEPRCSEPR